MRSARLACGDACDNNRYTTPSPPEPFVEPLLSSSYDDTLTGLRYDCHMRILWKWRHSCAWWIKGGPSPNPIHHRHVRETKPKELSMGMIAYAHPCICGCAHASGVRRADEPVQSDRAATATPRGRVTSQGG